MGKRKETELTELIEANPRWIPVTEKVYHNPNEANIDEPGFGLIDKLNGVGYVPKKTKEGDKVLLLVRRTQKDHHTDSNWYSIWTPGVNKETPKELGWVKQPIPEPKVSACAKRRAREIVVGNQLYFGGPFENVAIREPLPIGKKLRRRSGRGGRKPEFGHPV